MSEKKAKSTFMQELDQWIEDQVIEPLQEQWSRAQDGDLTTSTEPIKKVIRQKVLDSYHNGKKASQPKAEGRRAR